MTAEQYTTALPRLRRSLGVGMEEEERLRDVLEAAEEEILLYLGEQQLPEYAVCLMVELAGLKYLQKNSTTKSQSYSEGQLSQSESYYTPEEFREGTEALLRSLARHRKVQIRGAKQR